MRLQEDGLVLRNGHRGTVVTSLNPEEASEILALRRRIEVRAAPRAVRAVDAKALERLAALNARMVDAARAGDEYGLIVLDTAFHLEIFRLANLQALEQILVRCILHSHRQKLWEPRHRRPLVETASSSQRALRNAGGARRTGACRSNRTAHRHHRGSPIGAGRIMSIARRPRHAADPRGHARGAAGRLRGDADRRGTRRLEQRRCAVARSGAGGSPCR